MNAANDACTLIVDRDESHMNIKMGVKKIYTLRLINLRVVKIKKEERCKERYLPNFFDWISIFTKKKKNNNNTLTYSTFRITMSISVSLSAVLQEKRETNTIKLIDISTHKRNSTRSEWYFYLTKRARGMRFRVKLYNIYIR